MMTIVFLLQTLNLSLNSLAYLQRLSVFVSPAISSFKSITYLLNVMSNRVISSTLMETKEQEQIQQK